MSCKMKYKKCHKCEKYKKVIKFSYSKHSRDNLFSWCKICASSYRRNVRCKYPEREWILKPGNREKNNKQIRERYNRERKEVFNHYGGKCRWPKCTVKDFDGFTIDHILDDGHKERHIFRSSMFYKSIIDRKFPNTYQILCGTHQWIKERRRRRGAKIPKIVMSLYANN
jgi:hypothetical protein